MPWTPLYTPINKSECIGFSMPKINQYFFQIDEYIKNLETFTLFDSFLIASKNLSDLTNPLSARNNLGLGTAITKDQRMGAQAWAIIDYQGNIVSQFNVSSVVRRYDGNQHKAAIYEVIYTSSLSYVGPIMVTGGSRDGARMVDAMIALYEDDYGLGIITYPTTTRCFIATHDIDAAQHDSHYNEAGTATYFSVVVF